MIRFLLSLLLLLATTLAGAAPHRYTLVIDAGHGGKDAGAVGNGAKEKNINLSVALAFGRYVEQNCPDVRVIYTRKSDVFVPLRERADIANKNAADVFISIHTNALASKRPIRGMETYTMGMRRSDEKLSAAMRENEVILIENDYQQHYAGYDPRSPESMIMFEFLNETHMAESVELARLIQKNVCATAGRPDNGVKQDVFLVLRETSMPACLIELGYITTASDAAYLTNSANVDALGRGICQAFMAYRQKHGGPGATPVPPMIATPTPEEAPTPSVPESTPEGTKKSEKQPVAPPVETAAPKEKKAGAPEQKPAAEEEPSLVFKVQIMAVSRPLKTDDARLKELADVGYYQEGGVYKYTVGASANYNEMVRLRRNVAQRFPQAFVVAFENGQRTEINAAIAKFRSQKK